MSDFATLSLVLGVLFVAAFTRSAVGFGDALIAMPVLVLLIGLPLATPLVALISTIIALAILLRSWRQVDLQAAGRLIVTTLVGIPIGVFVITQAPVRVLEILLGIVVGGFGLYNLFAPRLPQLHSEGWAYLFGLIAGILGGAYNTGGPPVVIYGMLRRWHPDRFRATMQGFFLPTSLVILASHAVAGLWTPAVWGLFATSLPVVLAAVFLGGKMATRVPRGQFDRIVYLFLVIIGLFLLV